MRMSEFSPKPADRLTRSGAAVSVRQPAIYYFDPLLAGAPEHWGEHFRRASGMGFDSVLWAPRFPAGDEIAVTDRGTKYDVVHAALGGGHALDRLAGAVREADACGLRPMLDLDISVVAPGTAVVAQPPGRLAVSGRAAAFCYGGDHGGAVDWWDRRLAALQQSGVSGFRCVALDRLSPAIWRQLIAAARARAPATVFLAWTPGLAPAAITALRDVGFDFTFSSSAWWDFRAGWLQEDAERIASIGPAIAMTEPPDGFRCADLDAGGRASGRATLFAAHYAPGWLVPMGFEYGAGSWISRLTPGVRADAFKRLQSAPVFDLTAEIKHANAGRLRLGGAASAKVVSSAGAELALLVRDCGAGGRLVVAVNPSLGAGVEVPAARFQPLLGGANLAPVAGPEAPALTPAAKLRLRPAEVALFEAVPTPPIVLGAPARVDRDAARIAIEAIMPKVDDGEFPVRRVVGEMVEVEADILADGHGKLAVELLWRTADRTEWQSIPMALIANDRWRGAFPLERMGRHVFAISAWRDEFASLLDAIAKKSAAGVGIRLELEEALALVRAAAPVANDSGTPLARLLADGDEDTKTNILLSAEVIELMRRGDRRKFRSDSGEVIVDAERQAAVFASWYEIFPRSQSGDATRHGTFRDVIARLPAIRDMGFDVLYFPPIHPIGRINRKGRNNSLIAEPSDPGSPYAIGSAEGGHDAIHPELGTIADFHALVAAAVGHGLEIALDFAIQCAPDHPWLKQRPEWFDWRPDGSLRYAENPPKKYEDIVNVDFYAEGAMPSLWCALRDVVQYWVDQGIRLFRVDNPHTKPLPFWQWMITDIRARHPDVIFLAEAFTRPKIMYRLAKVGFSQSYTYFTWRNTKQELTEYFTELTGTAPKDYFRPHLFVNTPDINPFFLQTSGRPGFLIRAALAATLSGLWGVYNGFELCESAAIPGKEEYLDSEKYQIKPWDYDRPGNIIAEITRLNRIRRENDALHSHLGVEFLNADSDHILYFLKQASSGNTIVVAINLDPLLVHEAVIEIPTWKFGLPDDGVLEAEDMMRGNSFQLHGKRQHVRLDPHELPFHIWRLRHAPAGQA